MVTTVLMASNTLQRDVNLEQVLNRQQARLQNGYWLFGKPVGYRYVKDIAGGKIMVPDEPKASAVAEALEGFGLWAVRGAGRRGALPQPKRGVFGALSRKPCKALLTNVLYTGISSMSRGV